MTISQRDQNLVGNEVAEHQGARQSEKPHGKILVLKSEDRRGHHDSRECERRDSIYLHDARTPESRSHQFEFFLAKPAFSKDRAVSGSQ